MANAGTDSRVAVTVRDLRQLLELVGQLQKVASRGRLCGADARALNGIAARARGVLLGYLQLEFPGTRQGGG